MLVASSRNSPPTAQPASLRFRRILPIGSSNLPAPTRRRFAASVFPKFGLRPNGEDGSLLDRSVVAEHHERLVVPRPGVAVGLRSSAHALRHAAR